MKSEHPNKANSGSAFVWGLIIGALLASLLTTKRGRRILRELSEVAFDLIESFIEEKTTVKTKSVVVSIREKDKVEQDLESEITEMESSESSRDIEEFAQEDNKSLDEDVVKEAKPASLKKKRLFRGIRRTN